MKVFTALLVLIAISGSLSRPQHPKIPAPFGKPPVYKIDSKPLKSIPIEVKAVKHEKVIPIVPGIKPLPTIQDKKAPTKIVPIPLRKIEKKPVPIVAKPFKIADKSEKKPVPVPIVPKFKTVPKAKIAPIVPKPVAVQARPQIPGFEHVKIVPKPDEIVSKSIPIMGRFVNIETKKINNNKFEQVKIAPIQPRKIVKIAKDTSDVESIPLIN